MFLKVFRGHASASERQTDSWRSGLPEPQRRRGTPRPGAAAAPPSRSVLPHVSFTADALQSFQLVSVKP